MASALGCASKSTRSLASRERAAPTGHRPLASVRRHVAVLPRAELDVSITQPGNGDLALDALRWHAGRSGGLLEGGARFENADLWIVAGLNHFGWTDDASDFELGLDGPLEGDLDELRTTGNQLIDPALDQWLLGLGDGPTDVDGAERVTP